MTWQENRLLNKTFIYDFDFYYTLFSKKANFWHEKDVNPYLEFFMDLLKFLDIFTLGLMGTLWMLIQKKP